MLTLTITDPQTLSPSEKQALLAFAQVLNGLRSEPSPAPAPRPTPAPTPIAAPAEIAHADRPDTGKPADDAPLEIPRFGQAKVVPPVPAPPAIDAAAIFGKQPAAPEVSSVPIPPPVPPASSGVPMPPAAGVSDPTGAPAATAGGPPGGVAVDSRGFPWDVRIHASTKGQNGDGAWKKKKNVTPETIVAVEAELRALMGIPVAAVAPRLPAGAVPVADGETPTTFPQLMGWVSKAVADLKLTQADVTAIVAPIGLASVVGLNNRPDLIPAVYAKLTARVDEVAAGKVAPRACRLLSESLRASTRSTTSCKR